MTIKEAINHLHTYSSTNGSGQTTQEQHEEAKKMAREALASIEQVRKERDEARNALARLYSDPFCSKWLQEYTNKAQTAQPNLRPTCNQLAIDCISRQAAIDALVKRTCLPWEILKILHPMLCVLEKVPPAQPAQRWTPCSEGLPAPEEKYGKKWSEYVLVFGIGLSGTRGIAISQYYYDSDEPKESGWCEAYMYIDSGIMEEIIAWMPLPEPYKGR